MTGDHANDPTVPVTDKGPPPSKVEEKQGEGEELDHCGEKRQTAQSFRKEAETRVEMGALTYLPRGTLQI